MRRRTEWRAAWPAAASLTTAPSRQAATADQFECIYVAIVAIVIVVVTREGGAADRGPVAR